MPSTATANKPKTARAKSACGAGPGGFGAGNTCAKGRGKGKAGGNAPAAPKPDRASRLATVASKATAHHEKLAGATDPAVHARRAMLLDRAIKIKRAAHAARAEKLGAILKARREVAKGKPAPPASVPALAPKPTAKPAPPASDVHPVIRADKIIRDIAESAAVGKLDRVNLRQSLQDALSPVDSASRNRLTRDYGYKTHATADSAVDALHKGILKIEKSHAKSALGMILEAKAEARQRSQVKPEPRWIDAKVVEPAKATTPKALPSPSVPATPPAIAGGEKNTAGRARLAKRLLEARKATAK